MVLIKRSFIRCQFENWGVVTAYDRMVMHRDVYWYENLEQNELLNIVEVAKLSNTKRDTYI